MNKIIFSFLCLFVSLVLLSCNPPGSRDELRAKSSARADIIERSGTQIIDEKDALIDAENRLRTGGGLFGTKPSSLDMFTPGNNKQQTSSIGFPINPALWRGSLEVLEFMPLASADPFGGIIITDWYSDNKNVSERCKINIFIKGADLKSNNIKVNSFCQTLGLNNQWENNKINVQNNLRIENAILNKAKKIQLYSN